ncbi:ABC transporter permease [Priestia taiwanensis]|uniref:ABC transporter permease n=1 Tax=Priestia taiwanensis TaxID=1347902 RepID=A0A917AVJ6_9BACI|nr:ABC transporter permease [Priestia taiwanensis]MBM7363339.1 NitT/TauT family transport system permease protein [Priestia taiwanensis]GGE77954.1 ABC transporter permease [Priestia taiwanensis]
MNAHKPSFRTLHQQYIKRTKKTTHIIWSIQLAILVLFFAGWELASTQRWIDPLLFSSPSKIYTLFISNTQDGSLFPHVSVTIIETLVSFIIATILGTFIACMLWWFPMLSRIFDPYLVTLNAMPKVALGPIIIVIFGPNISSSIAMGVIISIIITIIVIYNAFTNVDANYIKVLQTFRSTKRQVFTEAVFPSSFSAIISTLKVNVGLSWVGVIVGEFLVSKEGLGYLINYGFQIFNFNLVLMSVLLIMVVAACMYVLVDALEKIIIRNDK